MKKVFLSALLASSALVLLADSAFAKDCPNLSTPTITVDESSEVIKLRTDPATERQTISNAEGESAVIKNGEELLIDTNESPQAPYGVCFYPVEINETNNPNNTNQDVLNHKPYWISEKGIKDYSSLVDETTRKSGNQGDTGKEKNKITNQNLSLPLWLPLILGLNLLSLPLLVLLAYWIYIQRKKIKRITSTLGDITISLDKQNLKLGKESQDIQFTIGRNKDHIKQLEELLQIQNKNLDGLGYYIKSEKFSNSISDSLKKTFEIMLESRQSELNKPSLASSNEQNEDSQQETEQTNYHDPFYDEVISQFNTTSLQWFFSLIEHKSFGKVQITKDSVLGQMDMGGKVTQLEFNEQGTLLIYQAGEKLWVIPDLTQSKWKRAITSSLFNGGGQILVRPAEVESVGNHLWQVKEKGEFR